MRVPKCRRLRRRDRAAQPISDPAPVMLRISAITVVEDGFPLTGRRYAGFIAEVHRRQALGKPQDTVTVWHPQDAGGYHTAGIPRINDQGDLEILSSEDDQRLGTVQEVDGALCFFPG